MYWIYGGGANSNPDSVSDISCGIGRGGDNSNPDLVSDVSWGTTGKSGSAVNIRFWWIPARARDGVGSSCVGMFRGGSASEPAATPESHV